MTGDPNHSLVGAPPHPHKVMILLQWGKWIPYWVEAARVMKEKQLSVTVGTLQSKGPLHEALREMGIESFSLDASGAVGYPGATRRLASLLRRQRPELIQGVGAIPTTIAGMSARLMKIGTCIHHRHHIAPAERWPFPRLANHLSHCTMAVSDAAARAAHAEGVSAERVCTALNGAVRNSATSIEGIDELRRSLGIPPDAFVISLIARLRRDRGHQIALEAVHSLLDRVPRSPHLVFVGNGPDAEHIRRLISSGGAGSYVHMVGEQTDVDPWFAVSDAIVAPSLLESFGLSIAEAMGRGKPVVASRTGGILETTRHEETALLFRPGDPTDLARNLRRLIEHPDLARNLGTAARARFERDLTIDAMVQRWIHCYNCFHPRGGKGLR